MLSEHERRVFDDIVSSLHDMDAAPTKRRRRQARVGLLFALGGFALCVLTFTTLLWVAITGLTLCYLGLLMLLRVTVALSREPGTRLSQLRALFPGRAR